MRRNVQLYIAGRRVDLGDDSWILYNWTREDMSNPTSVVNSSSHQIEIPGTCRNNAVFGAAFRLDRRTIFGSRYDGVNFDPTRKTPFALYADDGSVLEAGYCRLDAVNTHDRRHTYALTLYGGLGSMFYALAYAEDGSAKTLADLTWKDPDGNDITSFATFRAQTIIFAWRYLRDGTYDPGDWFNVVNFAPAYNGLPDDFDTSHALSTGDAYNNVPFGYTGDNGVYYSYKPGTDCALLAFTNPKTEWEVGDLRWYLQRPVLSVKAFIAAVCDPRNNGGYTVTLDPAFFRDDNPDYADAWWTLPMIATDDRATSAGIANVLASSKTPMQYLVDYCKHFGLLFIWDSGRRSVRIVTRATFYGEDTSVIDLSGRIDRSQPITQDPVLADKRWYQLGGGGKGQFIEQYRANYGKDYGIQTIDTAYEFDAETKVLTEGNAFQDAAEVQESSLLFATAYAIHSWGIEHVLLIPYYEKVTTQLWNGEDSVERDILFYDWYSNTMPSITYDTPSQPGLDWLPKLQTHGDDNKAEDGTDILLFFTGFRDTPTIATGLQKTYYLTDDDTTMTALAGAPCWDMRNIQYPQTSLPSFRRVVLSGQYITDAWEWGAPAVRAVIDAAYPAGEDNSLYGRWWKAYLADRYAADTRVLTAQVDLRGLSVGQALLRRFYWYDGALWVLNAIRNYSMTSWDLAECELIKVQDMDAYILGPGNYGSTFLVVSPIARTFTIAPGGATLTFTVRSSSAWTLSQSVVANWVSFSRSSGPAGTTVVTATITGNDSGARRSIAITFENADGKSVATQFMQAAQTAGAISVDPSVINIPASGTAIAGQASRGKSARVTADGAWAVDAATIPAWLTVTSSSYGVSLRAGANSGAVRTANLKIYLTGDPDTFVYLSVIQAEGQGGTGDITLLDENGNNSATVDPAGGSLTLYVRVPDADGWTITKSESWVSVSPVSGSDNGTLAVTIPANSGTAARQATITATRSGYSEGAIFYITQNAPAASSDSIEITRRDNTLYNNVVVGNGEEYEGFDVKATGAWTASANVSWLHVYGSAWSGSGNATRWFYTDVNTGAARTGIITATLTATGQTALFYVYQNGDGTVTLSASFNKTTINAAAQTIYLTVNAPQNVAWTIDSVDPALRPQSYSGTGPGEVEVGVLAFGGSTYRDISLTVRAAAYGLSATASVRQTASASADYLTVVPFGTVNVRADATSVTFQVQSSTSWRVSGPSTVLISPASGSGSGTVTVQFDPNTTLSSKTYAIVFQTTAGDTITVNVSIVQAASGTSAITATPTELTMAPAGESKTITVQASGAWTASKSASWIGIDVSSGASGTSTVTVTVRQNTDAGRTGTITFVCGDSTAVVTVYQGTAGALSVSDAAVSLPFTSGQSAEVTVYSSLAWAISADTPLPSWLSALYPQHIGDPNGETLTFTTVAANSEATPRSATVRVELIGDPTTYADIVVTQAGKSVIYVSPSSFQLGAGSAERTLEVTSNTSWRITSLPSGVTIDAQHQSGTGNVTIPVTIEANPLASDRALTIVFTTTDGTAAASAIIQQAARQFSVTSAVTVPASGAQQAATLVSSTAWTLDASSVPSWLIVSPISGDATTGTAIAIHAASYYDTTQDRSASISFLDAFGNRIACVVTQTRHEASPILIKPEYENAVLLPGVTTRTGTAEIECEGSWSVETDAESPLAVSVSSVGGTGDGTLTWTVTGITTEARTCHIRVRTIVRPEGGTLEETYEAVLTLVYRQSE